MLLSSLLHVKFSANGEKLNKFGMRVHIN